MVYRVTEEVPRLVYKVTEVPKENIPADELLYRILEPGTLSCDHNTQTKVGPLTVYPSLVHPKDDGPAGQTGLCKITWALPLLMLGFPLTASFFRSIHLYTPAPSE